ncbi:reticulon-4-interacting protein 1, mitochondrial-like isoform X1 [Diorhabda carinulata]|uniref:reticulon-4-interacting protein 1, mitochondrial-like isoform X1 n=2 Tax=Diorhabda carinulata TaxID=1163345 RepID=UPI0025A27FAC|nr:reticulon-4-interacting protein 1, mitochondrial-like isoform X1 [Diorhabda carinulata]
MDEILFRGSQRLEAIQIQSRVLTTKAKEIFETYIAQGKLYLIEAWNNPHISHIKVGVTEGSIRLISATNEFKEKIIMFMNPKQMYLAFLNIFGKKWTSRDIYFACGGLIIGGVVGLSIGIVYHKREPILRYMQAIHCTNYLGAESITVAEDAFAPYECINNKVLVNVKAASIQLIDIKICKGYGRNLRRILQRMYSQSNSDLPIILGRDCTGIVTDIGPKVTRLEVGDEVWLTVPFWMPGTLCQSVLVEENRIGRKPNNVGFEGACSLPYAGSLALSALVEARLDSMNAGGKKVLVEGGCTPVGCVLVQLLSQWKASVTATCYKRALPVVKALGATDIIVLYDISTPTDKFVPDNNRKEQNKAFIEQLENRDERFDIIFRTGAECECTEEELGAFLKTEGAFVSTLPPPIDSDSYGIFRRFLLYLYINIKYKLQNILSLPINTYDETHLCNVTLDRLSELVEDGYIQTVVDKIYQPQDIEIAVNHIQNPNSIGSTIITFR